jgi:predicted RND superfamily exporter protein
LNRTTLVSFLAGAVFLAVALRSGRESVLLVGGVAATTLAMVAGGMYLLGVPWNPLTVTTAAIVLGIGVDYAVHVYERFREEVTDGATPTDAVRTAVLQKARPVLGSGATTMLGFGVLVVSEFPVLSNFGLAIGLAMGLAMLTSFVFLPALVVLLGRRDYVPAGQ